MSASFESKLSEFALKVSRINAHFIKNGKLTSLERDLFQQWLSDMYEATLLADMDRPAVSQDIISTAPQAVITESAPIKSEPVSSKSEPVAAPEYVEQEAIVTPTPAQTVPAAPKADNPVAQMDAKEVTHAPKPSIPSVPTSEVAPTIESVVAPVAPTLASTPMQEQKTITQNLPPITPPSVVEIPNKTVEPAQEEVLSFDTPANTGSGVGGFSLGLSTDYQKTDLNQRYASQQEGEKQGMSMNDRLKKDASTTISGKLGKGDSLSDLIDLNKSFLFRNDLFAGNVEKYQQVIKQIDMFRSHEEALFFLEQIRSSLQINERNKSAWDLFLKTVRLKFQS